VRCLLLRQPTFAAEAPRPAAERRCHGRPVLTALVQQLMSLQLVLLAAALCQQPGS
jgi:hypothetical protein